MQALSESSKKWEAADSPQPVGESNEAEYRNTYKVRKPFENNFHFFNFSKISLFLKTGTSEDESSYSSFYSSFLKSEEPTSSNEGRVENNNEGQWNKTQKPPTKRPDPSWLDNIKLTNELVYQYQVDAVILKDVLNADLHALKKVNQVIEQISAWLKVNIIN